MTPLLWLSADHHPPRPPATPDLGDLATKVLQVVITGKKCDLTKFSISLNIQSEGIMGSRRTVFQLLPLFIQLDSLQYSLHSTSFVI